MTPFDIAVGLVSFAIAGMGSAVVARIVRTSGRDRPHDPEVVRRLIKNAPAYRRRSVAAE